MSGWAIFALIVLSLIGLGYLAATDAKRRRIFRQSPIETRPFAWPARIATFAPGIYFCLIGHWSGLTIWAGAVTTLGWAMVAIPPNRYAEARAIFNKKLHDVSAQSGPFLSRLISAGGAAARFALTHLENVRARLAASLGGFAITSRSADAETIARLEARIADLEDRLEAFEKTHRSDPPPSAEPVPLEARPRAVKNLDAAE
ncbi:MAG: hypothetical protein AAF678_10040 [Pseudomonadota bacterium]